MNKFLTCLAVVCALSAPAFANDAEDSKAAVERFIVATQAEKHTEARVKKHVSEMRLHYIDGWGRGGERLDRMMTLDKFEVLVIQGADPARLTRDYMRSVLTKYFTAAEINALADNATAKTDPGAKYKSLAKTISRETLDILQMRVDEAAAAAAKEAGLDPPLKVYPPR
jgi:ribosomal protein L4